MNKIKTLLLGSAAAVIVVTGAQAADPIYDDVKAPREPVYRCDITGFIELPGTDICWKIGGYARAVYTFNDKKALSYTPAGVAVDGLIAGPNGGYPAGQAGWGSLEDTGQWYGQGRLNFDARTQTEYGTLRGFVEVQANDNNGNTGGALNLRHAFVQLGNWTFGKTWSTFLHLDSGPNYSDPYNPVGDLFIRREQIRYTQEFGSGFSVSLAVEDANFGAGMNAPGLPAVGPRLPNLNPAVVPGLVAPFTSTVVANDRNSIPDVVGAIGVSGDWGSAQLSGALTNNEVRDFYLGSIFSGDTDSDLGWAASFGLALNTPTGEGDVFTFKAIYTDGASQYNNAMFAGGTNVIWGSCGVTANCIVDNVTTWSVLSSFTHFWTPTVSTTIGGGYGENDFGAPGTAVSLFGFYNFGVPIGAPGYSAVPVTKTAKVTEYSIFGNVEWSPVPRFSMMLDVHYNHLDYNGIDQVPEALKTGVQDDDGAWTVTLQATRSF